MRKLIACLVLTLCSGAALAQSWPERPIQMIVQFPPGTTTDTVARDIAKRLGDALKQSVVVVNKAGASGAIGVDAISKAKPDGYTIGTVNLPTLTIIPHLQKVPYEPLSAFTHLAVVGPYDYGVFVAASSPWKTFSELVDYGRANPGKLTYGTLGPGTTNQLAMEKIGVELGLNWTYVPYKGDTESVPALLGGQIQLINASPATTLPQVQAGKLRMLVSTGPRRWYGLPDVPTLRETKLVDFSQNSFFSIAAPANLEPVAKKKLDEALKAVLSDPEVKDLYVKRYGQAVAYQDGASFTEFVAKENALWGATLKATAR